MWRSGGGGGEQKGKEDESGSRHQKTLTGRGVLENRTLGAKGIAPMVETGQTKSRTDQYDSMVAKAGAGGKAIQKQKLEGNRERGGSRERERERKQEQRAIRKPRVQKERRGGNLFPPSNLQSAPINVGGPNIEKISAAALCATA